MATFPVSFVIISRAYYGLNSFWRLYTNDECHTFTHSFLLVYKVFRCLLLFDWSAKEEKSSTHTHTNFDILSHTSWFSFFLCGKKKSQFRLAEIAMVFFWKMWISIDDSIMKCLSSAHRTRIQRTRKWDRVIDFRFMSGTKWKWRQCNQSDATTENAKCLAFFYLFISIGNA